MEQEHKNLKPLLIAAVAAVTVLAVLLVLFFSSRKTSADQAIVLPEPPAQDAQQELPQPETSSIAEVSRENVQSMLEKSVHRPLSYHQSLQVVTYAGQTERIQSVELWVRGELAKVQVTDAFETKTILASADTVYLWYDDDSEPVSMARGADVSIDDLAGIPTYEAILQAQTSEIEETAFVNLPELEADCIYVRLTDGSCRQDYWVSLDSGLLCKQNVLSGTELLYLAEQTALEVYPEGDVALEGVFCLPDGTEPFSTEA